MSMQRREGGKGSHRCFERGSMGSSIASSVGEPFIHGAAGTPPVPATRVDERLPRSAQRAVLACRCAGWFCEMWLFAVIANWRAFPPAAVLLPVCVRLGLTNDRCR